MGVWIETHNMICYNLRFYVTPRVGVWIETIHMYNNFFHVGSLPAWECGLKPSLDKFDAVLNVTPRVGVWIETCKTLIHQRQQNVTPRVGVWIETKRKNNHFRVKSHSPRGSVD